MGQDSVARLARIDVPADGLILLIGAAASGKSTFAARHFAPDAVVSSDQLRAAMTGTESDQRINAAVFARLHHRVEERVYAGLLVVVDATNTDWMWRADLLGLARLKQRPAIAIVFNLPLEVCLAHDATRPRTVPASVIRRQVGDLGRDAGRLDLEGFAAVHVLGSVAAVDAVVLDIEKGPVARAPSP